MVLADRNLPICKQHATTYDDHEFQSNLILSACPENAFAETGCNLKKILYRESRSLIAFKT